MNENRFQRILKDRLQERFPSAIILKNDANFLQGFPDLLILYEDTWAALETKKSEKASIRPNQAYYVEELDKMSYSRFVNPDNIEEILDELQQVFKYGKPSRLFRG